MGDCLHSLTLTVRNVSRAVRDHCQLCGNAMYFCQWQLYGAILRETKFRSEPQAKVRDRQESVQLTVIYSTSSNSKLSMLRRKRWQERIDARCNEFV